MMNKSLLFTANRILLALFFALTSFLVNGQTYIVKTNVSSSQSRSTVYDYYFRSNSTNITPITSVTANYYYLIFNQKPTQFYYYEYNPENYGCSGPCGEEWTAGLNAIFSSNSCDPLIEGFYYGYDGPFNSEVPFVSLISNQVLVPPTATTDTFCDFVTLKAEGCTGTQRFFWHYSTNGSTYVNTNISTGFNEDFVFDKATYLPANYSGNIYFKVLIDSDSSITGDNIFSNIVSYNVRPCSPQIVGSPVLVQNVCSDSNHATATFTFDRPLNSGEYFSMTLLQETTPGNFSFFNSEPIYAADFTNQQYTAINLEPGVYLLRYQTLFTSNNLASSQPEDSDPFTITAPAPVTFSTTQVNVLCKNEPTGSITVTALGGSGSYLYSKDNGTTWQTTNLFSGLAAASYDILVKDSNDCLAPDGSQTLTITEPATRVTISNATVVDPILNGENTGSIDIDVLDGAPPYTYLWTYDNPNGVSSTFTPTDEDISALYAGTYTITVTDGSGCTTTASYTLVDPPVLVPIITVVQEIACFGDTTGVLSASATGGVPGYSFVWKKNGSFLSSDQQITGLSIGTYTLIVTDNVGGSQEIQYNLTQPASALSATYSATDVNCFGANNGSISITAQGGTPPYSYLWKRGTTTLPITTASINNLSPGSYSCQVIDSKGCVYEINAITISEPAVIEIVFSNVTHLVDASSNTGAISVSAIGGSGSLSYQWNTGQTTASIANLAAGSYALTITDVNNPSCTLVESYTVTAPPLFTVSIQEDNEIACYGESTAVLTAVASGGTQGNSPNEYSYSWSGPTIPFTEPTNLASLSNLPAGTYTVQVRDANNVLRTQSFTVTEPSVLTASYTKTDSSCFGLNNGSINLTPSGGTPSYTFSWRNEQNQVIATTQNINNLAPGTYSCVITDTKGCVYSVNNIVIDQPTALVFDSQSITPVSAVGASDGSIAVVVTTGTPPYMYAWTSSGAGVGTNSASLTNQPIGVYDLVVTDANGCSIANSYTISVIQLLTATIQELTSIACYGQATASIQVSPQGGLPPYSIGWDTGATTYALSGLAANTYSVTITDSNTPSSSYTTSYTVTQPSALVIDGITTTAIACFGSATGAIDMSVSGGTLPYTFVWKDQNNTTIGTTEDLINLSVGTYFCTITDANGCTVTTNSQTITTNTQLNATLTSQTNVLINGQNTGAIDITVTGGVMPYSYLWNTGSTTEDVMGLTAGSYSVVITDQVGCQTTLNNIVITAPSPLVVTPSIDTPIGCYGQATGQISLNVTGGVGPYVYTWNLPNGSISNQASLANLVAGEYTVSVRDVNNAVQTVSVILTEPSAIGGAFSSTAVSCGGNSDGSITITATGGTAPYSYQWNTGATTATISNAAVGNYVVLVSDANGCEQLFTGGSVLAAGGISITETLVDVSCGMPNSGSISLAVSGGSNQFAISWDNPSLSGFNVAGLSGGTYTGTITDTQNNCSVPFSYTLQEPAQVFFELPEIITLCQGQNTTLTPEVTGTDVTYSWTSDTGFTSSANSVTINEQGTYTLTVSTINGCSYTDTVFVEVLTESIVSEYLVASHTYKDEEIILINVSETTTEVYEWLFPIAAEIISSNAQTAVIKFAEEGVYEIGLKATNASGCELYDYHQLVVEENPGLPEDESNSILIKEFKVFPNPITQGATFNVVVELAYSLPISVSIYEVSLGSLIDVTSFSSNTVHSKAYTLPISSGIYYVVVRTPGNVQTKKLIIN